jgi:hypothetical protein
MRASIALSVAALAGLSASQTSVQDNYPYRIDPNSVSDSDRRTCPNTLSKSHTNPARNLVQQPKSPMPTHLPATARRYLDDDGRQRVRPRRPDVQLRVREQRLAQHHAVLADAALLHLPGVGQPVRHGLQRQQHVRRLVPVRYLKQSPLV